MIARWWQLQQTGRISYPSLQPDQLNWMMNHPSGSLRIRTQPYRP
jgi:hypothetical protein